MTEQQKFELQREVYLVTHPLLLVVAGWAVLAGAAALLLTATGLDSADSALAILLPEWAQIVWAVCYLIGGVLVLRGMLCLTLRDEVAGCVAIAGAQWVNDYAIVVVRGWSAGFISGVGIAVAAGLLIRVVLLLLRSRDARRA